VDRAQNRSGHKRSRVPVSFLSHNANPFYIVRERGCNRFPRRLDAAIKSVRGATRSPGIETVGRVCVEAGYAP